MIHMIHQTRVIIHGEVSNFSRNCMRGLDFSRYLISRALKLYFHFALFEQKESNIMHETKQCGLGHIIILLPVVFQLLESEIFSVRFVSSHSVGYLVKYQQIRDAALPHMAINVIQSLNLRTINPNQFTSMITK